MILKFVSVCSVCVYICAGESDEIRSILSRVRGDWLGTAMYFKSVGITVAFHSSSMYATTEELLIAAIGLVKY